MNIDMKDCMRNIWLVVMLVCSLHSLASEQELRDTVYFYNNWEQMFNLDPKGIVVDPYIEQMSPFELHFYMSEDELSEMIVKKHIAASLGDSVMLINTYYLSKNFKGDANRLSGFIPVFFNDKVAYAVYTGDPSVKEILFGSSEDDEWSMEYYYIDFQNNRVKRVTPSVLSELLEDYHDLKVRYEGMKDYKKRHIIEYYFLKYVERATQDIMRPSIFNFVE